MSILSLILIQPPSIKHGRFLISAICFVRNVMSLLYNFLLLQLLILCHVFVLAKKKFDSKPEIKLGTPELIKRDGYPIEVHKVITEDGYILEIHRIPHGKNNYKSNLTTSKSPILIQHGLASSSADWILMGPNEALGYILADAGYDVWLGNNRGNIYSKNHISMAPSNRRFWDFSYHELGVYDLPAMIDYVLNCTKREKLFYIGHSQGTTQFWVMMSQKPTYNAKIQLMVGLAPAAFTGNIRGPITKLARLTYMGVWIGEAFGYPEVRSRSVWEKFVSNTLCQNATSQFFCNNFLFIVTGLSQTNLSTANLTMIMNHIPAGASWKQVVHFGQGYIHPNHFRQFDYDNEQKNKRIYNSSIPPEYELNKVIAPVALFSSDGDRLATPEDTVLLKEKLGNVVFHKEIFMDSFTHYNFIWGKASITTVFEPILGLLAQYK
ncbi:gastric triacylglycerol lipase [Megachile rotundata]|uniref:gastric triacylglycerol lipase n=1 Tax=Megachile rotundata TaxID=143995 RepID=UPI000614A230|nr:PREDICTED: gastric triacylglycerol lipase-like [Megachile rotundata]XP_012153790.1 PREDICTED: gastric triacylglycerol lipase-like [Megachile rotundata]XP_012153791.1 PREDICTED: gastric triacylglycerol lipase-like [Megachile rotundata]XP_012153792.1 PREDICTED: gastric triacylglycerol lipase-like [Megachile rotundata]